MATQAKIYTRTGDDGTTGLLYGGRVRKDDPIIEANGAVDEAQAALGLARAEAEPGSELDQMLLAVEGDLWVLMAEVATRAENRHKLTSDVTLVSQAMVDSLESRIDDLLDRFEMPAQFVVPGQSRTSALLDLARTIVRRAERLAMSLEAPEIGQPASLVGRYLNRLSDLCWAMARWQEDQHLLARTARPRPEPSTPAHPGASTPAHPGASTPAHPGASTPAHPGTDLPSH
jgi:cob(I)alamin adenosyltransferase